MEKINWNIPKMSGDPINLSLEKGDRLFIVGANGSGKSAFDTMVGFKVSR